MRAPYAPKLEYKCDDYECCDNGCPVVTCSTCGKDWPCPDYIEAHTDTQVRRQIRWVARTFDPGDEDYAQWKAQQWVRAQITGGTDG